MNVREILTIATLKHHVTIIMVALSVLVKTVMMEMEHTAKVICTESL